jgi:LysM repeat protein/proteasome lid subunit RPN8/RPN11
MASCEGAAKMSNNQQENQQPESTPPQPPVNRQFRSVSDPARQTTNTGDASSTNADALTASSAGPVSEESSEQVTPGFRALSVPQEGLQTAATPGLSLSSQGQQSGFQPTAIRRYQPMEFALPQVYAQPENEQIARLRQDNWAYSSYDITAHHVSIPQLRVVMHERALKRIFHHASEDTWNERFGILIGGVYKEPGAGFWVELVEFIAAERVQASHVHVEVSQNEIGRLNVKVDEILAQTRDVVRKIGWYHTHPNHGIFMSSTDKDNQRFSYASPWHIALVVDPCRMLYGIFAGPDCRPVPQERVFVVTKAEASRANTPVYVGLLSLTSSSLARIEQEEQLPVHQDTGAETVRPRVEDAQPYPPGAVSEGSRLILPDPQEPATTHDTPETEGQQQTFQSSPATPPASGGRVSRHRFSPGRRYIVLIVGITFTLLLIIGAAGYMVFSIQSMLNEQEQQMQKIEKQIDVAQQNLLSLATTLASKHAQRSVLQTAIKLDPYSAEGQQAAARLQALGPPTHPYTVQKGDTLQKIAQKFDITMDKLLDANLPVKNMVKPQVKPGDYLQIPES